MKKDFNFNLSNVFDEETEMFPLMSNEDEEQINNEETPTVLPILPLRNTVLFPGVIIPITIGRDRSIKLVNETYKNDKVLGVLAQKDAAIETPTVSDLNSFGTVAHILKILKMPDGNITAIIQGRKRFELKEIIQQDPFYKATVTELIEQKPHKSNKAFNALVDSIRDISLHIINLSPNIPSEATIAIKNIQSPSFLINFVSSNMNVTLKEKQELLENMDLHDRAKKALSLLTKELQMLEMKNEIQSKVKTDLDKQQREYFLHQQMKLSLIHI